MKQKLLVPSAVISILSLSAGSFILSLDRMKSSEITLTHNMKEIDEKQLMVKKERDKLHDRPLVIETYEKEKRIRMGYREDADPQLLKQRFFIPAEKRYELRGISI